MLILIQFTSFWSILQNVFPLTLQFNIMQTPRAWLREFLSKIVSATLARIITDAIFGSGLLVLLYVFLRDEAESLIQGLGQLLLTKSPLYLFLILLCLLAAARYIISKWRARPQYFFLDYEFCKWRVDKKTGWIDEHPYCPKHQVPLVLSDAGRISGYYFCPIDNDTDNFPGNHNIHGIRQGAKNIAIAKVNKYLKS